MSPRVLLNLYRRMNDTVRYLTRHHPNTEYEHRRGNDYGPQPLPDLETVSCMVTVINMYGLIDELGKDSITSADIENVIGKHYDEYYSEDIDLVKNLLNIHYSDMSHMPLSIKIGMINSAFWRNSSGGKIDSEGVKAAIREVSEQTDNNNIVYIALEIAETMGMDYEFSDVVVV